MGDAGRGTPEWALATADELAWQAAEAVLVGAGLVALAERAVRDEDDGLLALAAMRGRLDRLVAGSAEVAAFVDTLLDVLAADDTLAHERDSHAVDPDRLTSFVEHLEAVTDDSGALVSELVTLTLGLSSGVAGSDLASLLDRVAVAVDGGALRPGPVDLAAQPGLFGTALDHELLSIVLAGLLGRALCAPGARVCVENGGGRVELAADGDGTLRAWCHPSRSSASWETPVSLADPTAFVVEHLDARRAPAAVRVLP